MCVRTMWCDAIDGALSIFSVVAAMRFFYLLHGGNEDCLVWFFRYNDASRGAGVCSVVEYVLLPSCNIEEFSFTPIDLDSISNESELVHKINVSESEADYQGTEIIILAKLNQLEPLAHIGPYRPLKKKMKIEERKENFSFCLVL